MKLSDFNYTLPSDLIAQEALQERSASRLLQIDTNVGATQFHDKKFSAVLDLINKNGI